MPTLNTATPLQANRAAADATLQASTRTPDHAKLQSLGTFLVGQFSNYERDRRMAELKWARNARQFLGVYDPEVESQLPKDKSRAYPRLTRVKCMSMLARLMNMLFPASEKNWTVSPSAVPNLSEEDLNLVLKTLGLAENPNVPLEDKMIELAIVEFAKARSANLELEIEDQLQELGGNKQVDYVALCRKVLASGIIYGLGVLKGPFARTQQQRTWTRDANGTPVAQTIDVLRPHFDFVPVWDYYPDMSAKYFHQMDGQFQRIVMARHQLVELADRPDFFGDVIRQYLRDHPIGNYRRRPHETDMKSMGVQNNVMDQDGRKYEVIVWDGYISAPSLVHAGFDIPQEKLDTHVEAIVWVIDGTVIKADMNPWVQLDVGLKVNTYHQFVFEEDESSIIGNGLPNIMRDSAMSVAAGARMLLDNASIACGPSVEINTDLLDMSRDVPQIGAYQNYYRTGIGPEAQIPAVRDIQINSHMKELLEVINLFREFADTETFIGAATGGDMSHGPSEPFRTATGASLLKGDAALPFKDVVRNYDSFTLSVISSIIAFNRQFNTKASIRGDHQAVARGATSLMAKEVRGMILDNLSQTLTQEDKRYLNPYELLVERLASRDIDTRAVLCDKEEAKRRDEAAAQRQAEQEARTSELIRAEVRKILAEGVKSLTQADKNAAAADATTVKTEVDIANAAMQTLEGGLHDETNKQSGEPAGDSGMPKGAKQQP